MSILTENTQTSIKTLSWTLFKERFFEDWEQGEHVSIIGPTGQGKTTLSLELLRRRDHVVAFATKPEDEQLKGLGWKRIKEWPPPPLLHKVLLWPRMREFEDVSTQKKVFKEALARIFTTGGWAVYFDETWYFTNVLKLGPLLELFWVQGRSLNISVIAGTQRPAYVPLLMYDQATHLFFFRDNDESNLRRISGIGWLNRSEIMKEVASLPRHHFLYINSRTGERIISKVEL